MPTSLRALLVCCAALAATPVAAQTGPVAPDRFAFSASEPDVPEKAGKVLRAHRIQGDAPVIDGSLDDRVWLAADSTSGMIQLDPDNLKPMTQGTTVRVLYDEKYLYVGAEMYETDPTAIITGLGRRDQLPPTDALAVGFDTQHDHRTGYVFTTNPSGVQADLFLFDDGNADREYNSIWEVETRVDAHGWTAEFRIPLSQMRFQAAASGRVVWGFDFKRDIQRTKESGEWIGRPRGAQGDASRWGHLVFEDGLVAPHRVEALPFGVGRADNPATTALEGGYDGGLDVRAGLGHSATVSATFNPDFGQVEADPAVLNLSVFESFFPEKRPFFLEDGSLFVPGYNLLQLFYSRRIGKRPSYVALDSSDVVVDRPDQTTILGATKLTGKNGATTYGFLSSITSAEHALVDAVGGIRTERLIEPMTSYSAARVQRDFGSGSTVGLLGTSVLRDGYADAFAGGFDYRIRWDRNRWQWNGHWAVSYAPLSGEMVSGVGGVSNLNFNSKHWFAGTHVHTFTPQFRISDLGFQRGRQDQTSWQGNLGYNQGDPSRRLRSYGGGLNWNLGYNHDGLRNEGTLQLFGNLRFLSYWGINTNATLQPATLDDLETRGGPPILNPSQFSWGFGINSDSRKSWTVSLNTSGSSDAAGGGRWGLDSSLNLRPSPRVQVSFSGSYSDQLDPAQWIKNQDVTGDGIDDNIFGELDNHLINVTLRGSAAVNRDLTFEAFLQPFVAVGDYRGIERLARAESFEFEPVAAEAVSDPDFNTKSLRGTFVVRWEYVPGSTVFLVWNVQGSDASRPGVFDARTDMRDVFGAPLDNRFIIKASYWLSL